MQSHKGDSTPPNHGSPELNITPTKEPRTELVTVRENIKSFLESLRPKIEKFFHEESHLSIWSPSSSVNAEIEKFYVDLEIPQISNQPNLLLHNLGKKDITNSEKLFGARRHQILCNTSGSGKTRLLLEGLCKNYGFYFAALVGTDGIGSADLQAVIRKMIDLSDWKGNVFDNQLSAEERGEYASSNDANACRRISRVLVARWCIFDTFIRIAKDAYGDDLPPHVKYEWLLFQILPRRFCGFDPFLTLIITCLYGTHQEELDVLKSEYQSNTLDGSIKLDLTSFFYVIDEAQAAGNQLMGHFADEGGTNKRPVLRPIIKILSSDSENFNIPIIVSGTGFSLDLFKEVLASGVVKSNHHPWNVHFTMGDFISKDTQLHYISQYLPSSFLDQTSGEALKDRSHEWLRGRHRLTATYLECVLQGEWKVDGPAAPHKLLNLYVSKITGFTPLDADRSILAQEGNATAMPFGGFSWDKLDSGLRSRLATSFYHYLTRGQYPLFDYDMRRLVEIGLGRFMPHETEIEPDTISAEDWEMAEATSPEAEMSETTSTDIEMSVEELVPDKMAAGPDSKPKVTIQEPLALVSLIRYLQSHGETLECHILRDAQVEKGMAFEKAVLLALTNILQNRDRLSKFFEFSGRTPGFARSTAQIVARDAYGGWIDYDNINGRPVLLSACPPVSAKDPEDVLRWLKEGQAGWCIPGTHMGPDLLARVRLNGQNDKILLLVVQAKCHMNEKSDKLSADTLTEAIKTVTPGNFFSSLSPTVERKKAIKEMLDGINVCKGFIPESPYNILRVVVSHPTKADFKSSSTHVRQALGEDHSPLATLSTDALNTAFATNPAAQGIIKSLKTPQERKREGYRRKNKRSLG